MRQVVLRKFGIEHLSVEAVERPAPQPDEVLVRMRAAALNYVDLAVVEGRLGPAVKPPFIPVADGAGVVEAVGADVGDFAPGDLVATVYIPPWRGGRYTTSLTSLKIRPGAGHIPGQLSEFKTFKAAEIIRVPSHLSASEAATLPIAGVTAWNALTYGQLRPGQTVLIHGTGGVSVFALQFAKLFGARAIITSSSEEKLARARQLGADGTINYKTASVVDEVRRITAGEGVDLVVETVGGSNLQASLEALRPEGHISVVGFLSGVDAHLDLIALNLKRATLTGVSVGSREDCEAMFAALSLHQLRPMISASYPMEQTREAFVLLKAGSHFGKIVVTIDR